MAACRLWSSVSAARRSTGSSSAMTRRGPLFSRARSSTRATNRVARVGPNSRANRAAESYGYAADAAAKGGVGEFDGSVAMRFIDPGHRRSWAKNLDLVRENDREAREALASARGGMR